MLQVETCANMWVAAHERGAPERYWHCRGCPIGAAHAGQAEATTSRLFAMSICARCDSGATRLIRGHLCVSCYNREREYLKGRNAKGNKPVLHPTLYPLEIRYRAGAEVKVKAIEHAVSTHELVVATLRDEPKQVTFACSVKHPPFHQGDLFA